MKISYKDPNKESWFLVSWALSNKCNYRCNYCPDFLHNGSSGHPNWIEVKNFIKNFQPSGKEVCYRITGGEPTFWKHFIDMAKLIKDQNHYFSFITNGSQTVEYYKEISQYSDGMIISYHDKYADPKHFIDIGNSSSCEVAINLMMPVDKTEFFKIIDIAKHIYNNAERIAIWPKVILNKTSGSFISNHVEEYDQEQLDIIKNWPYFRALNDKNLHRGDILFDENPTDGNKLIINGLNKHRNWTCWAGLHMLYIEWGKIYRAECFQGGPIGTLTDFKLPDTPVVCGKDVCSCLSDIYLKKEFIVLDQR